MKSGNPALGKNSFNNLRVSSNENMMTVSGTVNKTLLLLLLAIVSAAFTWYQFTENGFDAVANYAMVGCLGGFVLAMITIFKKSAAPVTAPLYAVFEGLALGAISALFEAQYQGITIQAVAMTFGIMLVMLLSYKTGLLVLSEKMKAGIIIATGGIALMYFASLIMGFFGINVSLVNSSSPMGIVISIVIVVIAAFNLLIDFDFVVRGSEMGLPKFMEWYGAFGLIMTLVWLYLEVLRLLAKRRR